MPIVLVAAVTEIRHITRPAAVITSVEEDTLQEIPDDAIASLRMPASLFGQQRIGKQHMGFLALHAMGELHRQGYYCTASGSPDLQVQPPRWYGVRYGSTELYSSTPLEIWRMPIAQHITQTDCFYIAAYICALQREIGI